MRQENDSARLHLVSHHLCPYVQRALIVLIEKRVAYKRSDIDLSDKPAWFLKLSPLGRTPVLETPIGTLFESQIIAEYVDEITGISLQASDPFQKARQRAWIQFGSEILSAISTLYNTDYEDVFALQVTKLRARFSRLEQEIFGPWFDGNTFQLIDGVYGTIFHYFDVFDTIAPLEILDGLTAVNSWRRNISKRPSVKKASGHDYHSRLLIFLETRQSILGNLARAKRLINSS